MMLKVAGKNRGYLKFIALTFGSAIFVISCLTPKSSRYNTVFKMRTYGNMTSIEKAGKPFAFRYRISNEDIDIWSDDSIHYEGKILFYTHGGRGRSRRAHTYALNYKIPDSLVNEIMHEFNALDIAHAIFVLPLHYTYTDSGHTLILVREGCDDCGINEFEYSNRTIYGRKTFGAPGRVDSFGNYIQNILATNKMFYQFIGCLPDGMYQHNMMEVDKTSE